MRVAPVGAYFHDDLDRVVDEARRSAIPTHAHPEGIAGAIAVALATALACRDELADLWPSLLARTPAGTVRDGLERASGLDVDAEHAAGALGSGIEICAYDTVPYALWCVARSTDYEEAIWTCLDGLPSPDSDRDTLLAIVGGVMACADPHGPPAAWLARREPLPETMAS